MPSSRLGDRLLYKTGQEGGNQLESHRAAVRWPVLGGLAAAGGFVFAYSRGRTSGSTLEERQRRLAGDELVPNAQVSVTHSRTLPAPPADVWPWLVQVGWGRGGWYTPRWVDLVFFPANRPSAAHILPMYQELHAGDVIPDGPPEAECGFVVTDIEPERHLVLRSTSHLPLSWRQHGWAEVDWTWTFVLVPSHDGRSTRLIFRWRSRTKPWWLTAAVHSFVIPADAVMSRGMLRGLDSRCRDLFSSSKSSSVLQ